MNGTSKVCPAPKLLIGALNDIQNVLLLMYAFRLCCSISQNTRGVYVIYTQGCQRRTYGTNEQSPRNP